MATKSINDFGISVMVLTYMLILLSTPFVDSANWAQASGEIQQNTAIPYTPSGSNLHWGPRYGMAVIVQPPVVSTDTGTVFLVGGDTYNGDTTQRDLKPGMQDSTHNGENGLKNDVWYMTGTAWFMKGDSRLRTKYKQKIPQVQSQLRWKQFKSDDRPPLGQTHDQWIQCDPFFRNTSSYKLNNCKHNDKVEIRWSPRRHHGGVFFKGHLVILGGRAREYVPLPEERAIGGIVGPRIADIEGAAVEQVFSLQREAIITKNDIWNSTDGITWNLVTPGCRVSQKELVFAGNPTDKKFGDATQKCSKNSDCYGAEYCDHSINACVCPMWSPREQHAVAVSGDFIYVSGGYVSVQVSRCGGYMCGDTDASSNRYYMSDLWRSSDGVHWTMMNNQAFMAPNPLWGNNPGPDSTLTVSAGRGGHQMLIFPYPEPEGEPYIWIFGGRGNDNSPGADEIYFNDVWVAPVSNLSRFYLLHQPGSHFPRTNQSDLSFFPSPSLFQKIPWQGRTGHSMALLPISAINPFTRVLFLYGGYTPDNNGTFLDDCWSWRMDDEGEFWRQDFSDQELFSSGVESQFIYYNNSPTTVYVTPDSDVSFLQRYWVPAKPSKDKGGRLEQRPYMTSEKLQMLYSVDVKTIRDLAEIDLYTVLKLRGFDYPQVALDKRLDFLDICDYRELAIQLVEKCTINLPNLYDGERNMPWNIKNVFGGDYPANDSVAWHGRQHFVPPVVTVDDIVTLTAEWDGCTYVPAIEGLFGPNVDGLGNVDQVLSITDPLATLEELFCRQYPLGRAYHSLIVFEQRVYIMGGKQSEKVFYADTWYRDDNLPVAEISGQPRTLTPDAWFQFVSDKPGVFFEYRVWDPYNYKELRPWTPVTHKTSIAWLDWREGGPGNGYYQLYVRAVDPAGNRDERYVMGSNVYEWYYVSPTPWDIIAEVIGGFIGLCIIAYMEYRRRVKKAAMERYAMKRMRRKFKAMQRDINGKAVDWRTLYTEQKQQEELNGIVKTKKKKKKDRDKNAEKREKDKKKREKEKELIKKKLKATKDFKGGKGDGKGPPPGIQEAVPIGNNKKGGKGGKGSKVDPLDEDDEVDELEAGFNDELVKKGGKLGGPRAKLKKNKVAIEEATPMSPEDMFMDKSNMKGGPSGSRIGGGGGASVRSAPGKGSQLKIEGSSKEVKAGDLKSSKDTEKGVKQRKVNKKYYDDGGGGGAIAEEIEEKEDDVEHKNKNN